MLKSTSREPGNLRAKSHPVIWKAQAALVVGVAFSRDDLISRLEAAPTWSYLAAWICRISAKGNSTLRNSIFNSAILYIMSGTGNTYRMACWMKEIAGACMQQIKVVMIDEADAGNEAGSSSWQKSCSPITAVWVVDCAPGFVPIRPLR